MFRGNSFLATLDVYNVDKCASAKDFRESSIDRPTSIVTRAINLIFYPYDFEKSNKLKVLRNSLGARFIGSEIGREGLQSRSFRQQLGDQP